MPKKSDKQFQLQYKFIGKHVNIAKEILRAIPQPFKPTEKIVYIFLILFCLVIGIGIGKAMMPMMNLSFDPNSEETFELKINVGWPMQFFGTNEDNADITMKYGGLIVDILVLILLSYVVDILINLFFAIKLGPTALELKQRPKVFKFQEKSATEKATDKIIDKTTKGKINQPTNQGTKQPTGQDTKQPASTTAKQPASQDAKQPASTTAKQPASQETKLIGATEEEIKKAKEAEEKRIAEEKKLKEKQNKFSTAEYLG